MQLSFQKGSRSRVLGGLLLVVMALFVIRLFYLQIIMHDDYVAQATAEQVKPLTIPAKRGLIYALDGDTPVQLVMNQTVYTMFVDPATVTQPDKIADVARRVAGGNLRPNIEKLIAMKDTRYQIIATKLTRQQAEMIKKEDLNGVGFQEMSQRVYPEGSLASQTLGFVNGEGKGQYGVEEGLNDRLTGHDGLLKSVTDVSGVPLTIGDKNINKPAKNGDNLVLTIDRNIQAKTEQVLADGVKKSGADHASAIIMDPQTGKVMAMANVPTYDPSQINKITDFAQVNNSTVTAPYEPGSDIKTFTVATGVDKGAITPSSTYDNTGQIKVDDITINNATKTAAVTGNISMQTALNWSLNTGMVTIAERLGDGNYITRGARDTMYDYFYNRFRLGQKTGIELAGEQPGTIIPPTDVQGNAVRYSNMSFGQGMDATMLQVVSGFSSVINGGTYHVPTVVDGTMSDDGITFTPAAARQTYPGVVKQSTSATLREMVHQAHYATYNPHDGSDKYFIGGKTGTSQTVVDGKYVNDQTIGTYLGFGGETSAAPRYVIMVEISAKDKSMGGGTDAKPIFNTISNWLIDYLKLQPKG